MVWTPKTGVPSVFNMATALAATIQGDASLAWLTQFVPWLSGTAVSTTDFCAAGPPSTSPLVLSDFVPPLTTDGAALFAWQQSLSVKLELFARDRQFGAFCELLGGPLVGGYGSWVDYAITGSPTTTTDVHVRIPAGATSMQYMQTLSSCTGDIRGGGNIDMADVGFGAFSHIWGWDCTSVPPDNGAINTVALGAWYWVLPSNKYGAHTTWRIRFNVADATTVHTPAAQANPGLPAPLTTGADLASIAHELDRQEGKLDFLIGLAQLATASNPTLAGARGTPVAVVAGGAPIDLVDAIGVVVSLTGVPDGAIRLSGNPPQLMRCGYINFGTADAWYASIPITHTPMVVQPLPPLTTRMSATIYPPSSGTITPILRPK